MNIFSLIKVQEPKSTNNPIDKDSLRGYFVQHYPTGKSPKMANTAFKQR